jgi:RES domain-containing protein
MTSVPIVAPEPGTSFVRVEGVFYRAVDRRYLAQALQGSPAAGRYSRPEQPTLYASASPEGVAAAMIAHTRGEAPERVLVRLAVEASPILDLRDAKACQALGIDLADATAAWQEIAAAGGTPRSWSVSDRLRRAGAHGLIDPSRTAPGLWHLVLFAWNQDGGPKVRLLA